MTNQILNIDDIEYQAAATRMSPVIAECPDSDKMGVLTEFPDKDGGKPTVMRYIIRDQAGMAEYWEGE